MVRFWRGALAGCSISHPLLRWPLVRMRYRVGNVLQDQGYCESIGASPHNPLECARVFRQALHLLGNPAEAEEVAQDVFVAFYEKARTFRGESALATWLYRLTANAALSRLRRRQRSKEVALDDYLPQLREDGHHLVRPVVDWSADLEQGLAHAQLQQRLRQAIELLPPLGKA